MGFFDISNPNLPAWIQAATNTVVLIFIYWQLGQVREQMVQSDEQSRFSRSWEFLQFYEAQVREADKFYEPRISVFRLLNQLMSLQQVDERILFGYLEQDFNRFVQIGIEQCGRENFNREVKSQIQLLLTSWDPPALREKEKKS